MVSKSKKLERYSWLADNGFILYTGKEWRHRNEKFMLLDESVLNYSEDEWDRMTDSFDYWTNNE